MKYTFESQILNEFLSIAKLTFFKMLTKTQYSYIKSQHLK